MTRSTLDCGHLARRMRDNRNPPNPKQRPTPQPHRYLRLPEIGFDLTSLRRVLPRLQYSLHYRAISRSATAEWLTYFATSITCGFPARAQPALEVLLTPVKLLLVDDDDLVRSGLQIVLEASEFDVTVASNVNEALQRIANEPFDVLLSDLHMPNPGDGLTVVSAMRHAHPKAVTIVLSANPDMLQAALALVKQTDEIVRKPVKNSSIVDVIRQRLARNNSSAGSSR
jgi:CheY-like chemotaxis protein